MRASSTSPWLEAHASDYEPVLTALREVPISRYCEISGVDEALVRAATRRIAAASSVATLEDLGVQMNRQLDARDPDLFTHGDPPGWVTRLAAARTLP